MRWTYVWLTVLGIVSPAHAQPLPPADPAAPRALPNSLNEAPVVNASGLVRFDPSQLELKRIDNRWQLWAGPQFLRDFGPQEREAQEALRLVRNLNFTQYGVIPGATPPFEFWLADNQGAKGGLSVKNYFPFNSKALRLEQITGAWVIRDDSKMLYNFGTQHEAGQQALAVMKKFGFNQLGFIGVPTPVMTYLTVDVFARTEQSPGKPEMKEMLNKIASQGLVLPNLGYVGSRIPIEYRKLDIVHLQNEWAIVHGKEILAHFGNFSIPARDGLRLLQDSHVTELCRIGRAGVPIFLSNGQAPKMAALGFNNIRIQPAQLKAQAINNVWSITHGVQTLYEFGDDRADAELVLKVLQYFQFDQICPIGDANRGGIRLLTRTK